MEKNLLILMIGMFFTGIMDAVAGEGGLISTPLLMLLGLPPKVAHATNKAIAGLGNVATCTGFIRAKKVRFDKVKIIVPVMLVGTIIGVQIFNRVSNKFMGRLVPVMLVILLVYTLVGKNLGLKEKIVEDTMKNRVISIGFLFLIGIYDGFYGAASGAFMSLIFMMIFGFEIVNSLATSRFMNLLICWVAVITILFTAPQLLDWQVVIAAAIGRMTGGYVGSIIAVKKGAKYIKPIFTVALIIAIIEMFKKYYF